MKLMWLGYLVYNISNCVMKLCIETDLRGEDKWGEQGPMSPLKSPLIFSKFK